MTVPSPKRAVKKPRPDKFTYYAVLGVTIALLIFSRVAPVTPLIAAALALAPWLGIFWARQANANWISGQHPSIFLIFFMPLIFLACAQNIQIHDWQIALVAGIFIGCVYVNILFQVTLVKLPVTRTQRVYSPEHLQRLRWLAMFFMLLIAGTPYGYAMILFTDSMLDSSPSTVIHAKVVEKHIARGKGKSYVVKLEPWGPFEKPETEFVYPNIYAMIPADGYACIQTHPGALGIFWYTILPCPPDSAD